MLPIENLRANPAFGLTVERDLESLRYEALADELYGSGTRVEGLGDFDVSPIRAISIRLQENLRASHLLRRDPSLLNQPIQRLPLRIRQPNNILLLHDPTLLGWAKHVQNRLDTLPEIRSVTEH